MIPYIVPVSPSSGESIKLFVEQYPLLFYVFAGWFVAFQLFVLYLLFDMFRHGEDFIEKFMPCILGFGLIILLFIVDNIIFHAML